MSSTIDIPENPPLLKKRASAGAEVVDAPGMAAAAGDTEFQGGGETELSAVAVDRPVLIEVTERSPESERSGRCSRRFLLRLAVGTILAGALAAAAALGLLRPDLSREAAPAGPALAEPSEPADVPAGPPPAPVPPEPTEWAGRIRELERRRSQLRAKADEVRALQAHYRYGVLELAEDAVRLIKIHGIDTFAQAMRHRQLELALHSIRDREAYAAGLAKPLRWLISGSEELLYLQRLVAIDREVLALAEGIDLDGHAERVDAALEGYRPTAEKLAMGTEEAPPALDLLFKRLVDQARQMALPATDNADAAIAEEVCAGEMTRYSEVAVLRLKAVRCLAESAATELFLNRVQDLPATAAQKLSEWPGEWLCLNGLKRISPEAARHLFAWPGRWMSLNGLVELPAAASAHLPAWGGRQIELMGLRKVEVVEHLVRWEEAGGKLFVPEEIRRQIDAGRKAARGEEKRG